MGRKNLQIGVESMKNRIKCNPLSKSISLASQAKQTEAFTFSLDFSLNLKVPASETF